MDKGLIWSFKVESIGCSINKQKMEMVKQKNRNSQIEKWLSGNGMMEQMETEHKKNLFHFAYQNRKYLLYNASGLDHIF